MRGYTYDLDVASFPGLPPSHVISRGKREGLGTTCERGRPGNEATSTFVRTGSHAYGSYTVPLYLPYVAAHDVSVQTLPPLIFLCVRVKGEGLGMRLQVHPVRNTFIWDRPVHSCSICHLFTVHS